MKNVKLAGGAGSEDQEAMKEFGTYLLSVIQEKSYVEELLFNVDEADFFHKDAGK